MKPVGMEALVEADLRQFGLPGSSSGRLSRFTSAGSLLYYHSDGLGKPS